MTNFWLLVRLVALVTFFASATTLWAQESGVAINDEGKSISQLKHAWKAKWITHPTAPTLEYGVFHFRKAFELAGVPQEFIVYVSGDNHYRLFVNGQPAGFGPSCGDLRHHRYETYDISPHLRAGKNLIAAQVVNFGEHRPATIQTCQTGFILQGGEQNPVNVNTGDAGWLVHKNLAYESVVFTSKDLGGYYAAGPGDRVDASQYPWGWNEPEYNDGSWTPARLATVEFAAGRGFLYGGTWLLVPREIPFLDERRERFKRVRRSDAIEPTGGWLRGEAPLTVPPHSMVSFLLDNDAHTTGYPELLYSGGAAGKVRLTYAESLFDQRGEKGNREVVQGKTIRGYYDEVLPDGGEQRLFKPLGRRTYRYVQVDITTQDAPLVLEDIYGVQTVYPFERLASFRCDDPVVNAIWEASWLTLKNSSTDAYVDPYYEQLQYVGDARIEAVGTLLMSDDDRLMRKAIAVFDDSRLPIGLTQSRYPSYITQVIPTYSLQWIGMIHDHYQRRKDPELVQRFLPGVRAALGWYEDRIDSTGMPTGFEWWNFIDWSPGFKNGIPPGADDGHSALVALHFVKAAQEASELFAACGLEQEAEKHALITAKVQQAVRRLCYVAEERLIASTPEKALYSQHAQIMAILTDTVPEEEQPDLLLRALSDSRLAPLTIYYRYFLSQALRKADLGTEYHLELGPWKAMLDVGLTTFAEKDVHLRPRSDCHGWSASPTVDFIELIAGVTAAEPGYSAVRIRPALGDLVWVEAEVPTPHGIVKVSWAKKEQRGLTGRITLPAGVSGSFEWQGHEKALQPGETSIELLGN